MRPGYLRYSSSFSLLKTNVICMHVRMKSVEDRAF
jgi:hypothetical protein